ncbi:xanthine dehydrogenase family protein molybdopterin-binding subunit [Chitinophaga ginsengisegetis]|uniref:xanthine dehydrogenase family protein molybdopterin-binding subunit n=1 Tax=Chitinophaga ginsengisegetis TaxID=393003 RepID=UPI000DBA5AED|nr:molybdopterin cofactor-binding domain-containing protein [Chitinophaga ginsengisegetis]MDR6568770.1 isoquinoline 1-oxidoreductase [Chitinophaga ginsengisegetis]MDR6647999.1 isoquinoline 1-oxidoreductase [Chitinophaga ginsengisegetis]MDR6654851.1 isoquinoline 1-oxidoreductase [Chitinophaga ginsengisegetis]
MKNPGTAQTPVEGLNRRNFLKLLGGGIAVALTYSDLNALSKHTAFAGDDAIAAWIHILENGTVTVYTGKVEVGQNIRTSLSQAVAEELSVPVNSIEMIMGDTLLTPYDRGTYGSLTTPVMALQLRKAAASLKEVLTDMAAKQWNVAKQAVEAKNGQVIHAASGKTISFGDLTKGKKILLAVNNQVQLTPAEKWSVAGTPVAKVNAKSFVSGKHKYVSDMTVPGMVYGKILRAPSYGASLIAADIKNAKISPDVHVVKEDNFIGVTAPDPQTAANALARIEARWKTTAQPSRAEIFTYLKTHSQDKEEKAGEAVDKAFQAAPVQVQQHFEVQYIAHVPLEPRAALAVWENEKLTVWTGTQRPFGVQEELAEILSIPKNNIRVMMPDTGSAYGGKHSGEAAVEAARLSRAVGKPVKVMWTREEEFKWAYFRPGGLIEVAAGASNEGLLTSWEFHNYNSGGAGIEVPYEVAHRHIQYHPSDTPLKQGSYRGLAATANVFSIESVMDDLARQLKQDPLQFRLNNLKDERLKQVLQAAASKFGWTRQKEAGHGYGIAGAFIKNAYVGTCAEVIYNKSNGQLQILRLVLAFECGAIVNPLHLENQVMGCVLQGLGGALFEAVDFKDGRILNPSLSSYRVPRFGDIPELDIVLLNRKDIPSAGAGEAPIVGVAPAIRNAIADVTGVKLYTLPLLPHGMTLKT